MILPQTVTLYALSGSPGGLILGWLCYHYRLLSSLFITQFCAGFFVLLYLRTFLLMMPPPWPWPSHTLQWVVGSGCIQLEPAVSGWDILGRGSGTPCSGWLDPAGSGCVWLGQPWPPFLEPLLLLRPGARTQCSITYIQIFLVEQSKILSWENTLYFSAKFINICKLSASLASCQQGSLAASFCAGR